jgi:hypothetical protein
MWDAAPLIDGDLLIATLLERDKPTNEPHTVLADLDVDTIDDVPVTTYRLMLSGQDDANGPGLWNAQLALNLYVEAGSGFDVARHWYAAVHRWTLPEGPKQGFVEGVGAVEAVNDTSVFDRIQTNVPMIGKHVDHLVGLFGLRLRSL